MLVLSRRLYETIVIGDDIEVTVVEILADRVKLGVTAPKRIEIDRREVRCRKRRDREYVNGGWS